MTDGSDDADHHDDAGDKDTTDARRDERPDDLLADEREARLGVRRGDKRQPLSDDDVDEERQFGPHGREAPSTPTASPDGNYGRTSQVRERSSDQADDEPSPRRLRAGDPMGPSSSSWVRIAHQQWRLPG